MTRPDATLPGDAQSGVTLVEILVALAIMALALAIAGTGLRLLAHSGDRGAAVIARHEVLSRGIDVLRRDIERLERVVAKRGGRSEFVFRGDPAHLAFVVIEPPFPTEPGPYVVSYTILQRRDGVELTRDRAPYDAAGTDLERLRTADPVTVVEGPYRLRFSYLEVADGRQRWLPQWADPYSLPALVSLEVSGLAGADPLAAPIVFRPRADAERSCIKEAGASCTIGSQGRLQPEGQSPGGAN